MPKSAKKQRPPRVSPLEIQYRQWFQQTTLDDFVPRIPETFSVEPLPSRTRIVTRNFTTYGAYEEPISFE